MIYPPRLRRQFSGCDEVSAALDEGIALGLVLVRRDSIDQRTREVLARLERAGVKIRGASRNDLKRMQKSAGEPEMLALSGPDPGAPVAEWMASKFPVWLLSGISYPGNAGFAIRCAEVSGAAGIILDTEFDGRARRAALRASMYADRFMPVLWADAQRACALARAAGRRIVVVEDCGTRAPWECKLDPASLFVVGAEERGVEESVLDQADEILRLPMEGFIPSYNLQAAMAMVIAELLRQGHTRAGS
ncbi:MAG TPA: TrmH family RNA methyltransferase [Candidatus Krumholzibacteria bacterium]|nr:TrmH family RNA methyltransferase [Candidatus Krumholzibacteria bacterium]